MTNDTRVIIPLKGRISSSNVQDEEAAVFELLKDIEGKDIVFDASELEYISSAGLRMLMKVKKKFNCEVCVTDVSQEVYDVLETTGFTQLLTVQKRRRSVDVTGCEVIGDGFYGTVYRLDPDTIIKVYKSGDSLPMIENEKRMAKIAFIKGIPTAISYDIVKVGDSYGSVFELLNARTFNDLIIAEPDRADDIIKKYVDFLKLVHSTTVSPQELPSARKANIERLNTVREIIGDDRYNRIRQLYESVNDGNGVVHGDFQMKNVMLVDDEPMLIDMDTLSRGDPVFDLAGLCVTYRLFGEDDPDNAKSFLGQENEMMERIWNGIMKYYFDTADEDKLSETENRIRLVASIRFLHILSISGLIDDELGQLRLRHTIEHIDRLLETVNDISISAC